MPIHQRTSLVLWCFVFFVEINPRLLFSLIWCAENKSICCMPWVAFNQFKPIFFLARVIFVIRRYLSLWSCLRAKLSCFSKCFFSFAFEFNILSCYFCFRSGQFSAMRLSRKWNEIWLFSRCHPLALNKRKSSEILCFSFIFEYVFLRWLSECVLNGQFHFGYASE